MCKTYGQQFLLWSLEVKILCCKGYPVQYFKIKLPEVNKVFMGQGRSWWGGNTETGSGSGNGKGKTNVNC